MSFQEECSFALGIVLIRTILVQLESHLLTSLQVVDVFYAKISQLNDVSFFKAWNVGCTSGQHVRFFPVDTATCQFSLRSIDWSCVQLTCCFIA